MLEALARGLPVVATPHGVLGLGVGRADGCLVGESPVELAAALAEAADPVANAALSAGARRSWQQQFAPESASLAYDEVFGLQAPEVAAAEDRT